MSNCSRLRFILDKQIKGGRHTCKRSANIHNIHLHTYIHTRMHKYIHTYTDTHGHQCTFAHTHTHTNIHCYRHRCTQTKIRTYAQTWIETYKHTKIKTTSADLNMKAGWRCLRSSWLSLCCLQIQYYEESLQAIWQVSLQHSHLQPSEGTCCPLRSTHKHSNSTLMRLKPLP